MWYEREEEEINIDLNKPIVANRSGELCLLVPQLKAESGYKTIGFNWLSLSGGEYASSCFFETAEKAIEAWRNYDVYNADLVVTKR